MGRSWRINEDDAGSYTEMRDVGGCELGMCYEVSCGGGLEVLEESEGSWP